MSTELDYDGWLGNFSDDSDRAIAEHILDFFTYYSKKMVNQMLATSVGGAGRILKDHYADWTHSHFRQRCIYSFIPGEIPNDSDSGHIFIRKIREIANIPQAQLVGFDELFDYLEHNSSNPIPVILVYAPLIINKVGFDLIKRECPELFLSPAHIIGEEYNLFNENCICWNNDKILYTNGTEMIVDHSPHYWAELRWSV